MAFKKLLQFRPRRVFGQHLSLVSSRRFSLGPASSSREMCLQSAVAGAEDLDEYWMEKIGNKTYWMYKIVTVSCTGTIMCLSYKN